MRRRPAKPPTLAHKRTMLGALLLQREDITAVDTASLSRSYGVPIGEVVEMVSAEQRRRAVARSQA